MGRNRCSTYTAGSSRLASSTIPNSLSSSGSIVHKQSQEQSQKAKTRQACSCFLLLLSHARLSFFGKFVTEEAHFLFRKATSKPQSKLSSLFLFLTSLSLSLSLFSFLLSLCLSFSFSFSFSSLFLFLTLTLSLSSFFLLLSLSFFLLLFLPSSLLLSFTILSIHSSHGFAAGMGCHGAGKAVC